MGRGSKGPRQRVEVIDKEKAPFTIGDIKAVIPKHLFERPLHKSFYHLGKDLVEVALAFAFVYYVILSVENIFVAGALWAAYWWYQGATFTGLWVLAHECGHEAFSDYTIVNDTVGFVLHTMLYVPFYSWKFSHAKHHMNTNHMTRDDVFVPEKATPTTYKSYMHHPLVTVVHSVLMLTIGWPLYLLYNATGPKTEHKGIISHYDPWAPIFRRKDAWKIMLSVAGLVAWTVVLNAVAARIGWLMLAKLYLPPLMITNMWLVSITFNQHTDYRVPHFEDHEWNWLRGALCTIDRSGGAWIDYKLHHIIDSHVVHHMFHTMPFYHAKQACDYVVPFLNKHGKFHLEDKKDGFVGFWRAYWSNMRACNQVDGQGTLWFIQLDD